MQGLDGQARQATRTDAVDDPGEPSRTARPARPLIQADDLMRLVLAHIVVDRGPSLEPPAAGHSECDGDAPRRGRPCSVDVAAFTDRLLLPDPAAAFQYIEALRRSGWSRADIPLRALAPAAHRLGDLWQDDSCDFMDVSVAVGRLQTMLNLLDSDGAPVSSGAGRRGSALFLPAPGETHTLGVSIVDRTFASAGWRSRCGSPDSLVRDVAETAFDVVGFSIGAARCAGALTEAVAQARRASRNPDVVVLVGGKALLDDPPLCGRVGADATAPDAQAAVALAECLLSRQVLV